MNFKQLYPIIKLTLYLCNKVCIKEKEFGKPHSRPAGNRWSTAWRPRTVYRGCHPAAKWANVIANITAEAGWSWHGTVQNFTCKERLFRGYMNGNDVGTTCQKAPKTVNWLFSVVSFLHLVVLLFYEPSNENRSFKDKKREHLSTLKCVDIGELYRAYIIKVRCEITSSAKI